MTTPNIKINIISPTINPSSDCGCKPPATKADVLDNKLADLTEQLTGLRRRTLILMTCAGLLFLPCVPYSWFREHKENPLDYLFIALLLFGGVLLVIAKYMSNRQFFIRVEMGQVLKEIENISASKTKLCP
jgi:hypothetical protein